MPVRSRVNIEHNTTFAGVRSLARFSKCAVSQCLFEWLNVLLGVFISVSRGATNLITLLVYLPLACVSLYLLAMLI